MLLTCDAGSPVVGEDTCSKPRDAGDVSWPFSCAVIKIFIAATVEKVEPAKEVAERNNEVVVSMDLKYRSRFELILVLGDEFR